MREKFDAIEDYQCIAESYTTDGERLWRRTFNYYFKKPKLIRMEVAEGQFPGTVLIYNPDIFQDKVCLEAPSKFLTIVQKIARGRFIDLDDHWVTDLRGRGVHESDWGTFIDEHLRFVRTIGGRYEIHYEGEEAMNGRQALVYTIVSTNPEETLLVKEEKMWLDKETYFPLKYIFYDSAYRVMRKTSHSDIKINVNLQDDMFQPKSSDTQ
jgi:outer membrane lipoprotein-sorting protein